MLDVMNEDYVRTARAKGLDERRVMTRHVLRNSLIPIITLFGLDFGATIGRRRDHHRSDLQPRRGRPVRGANRSPTSTCRRLMAITLFGAFFVVLFNALVDIVYAYLDPRIRLGSSAQ